MPKAFCTIIACGIEPALSSKERTLYRRKSVTLYRRKRVIGRREERGGYSKGSHRLTCTAQPGHGGKRRDSPEERVSSAITDLMQMIDHKPNNQIETQYSDIIFGTLEWLGVTSS